MRSLWFTHCFGSCLAEIIVIKPHTKKTIMSPRPLHEKNEINQELTTSRWSQGVGSEPSPDNPHTLDAKGLIPGTHHSQGIHLTSFRHLQRRYLPRSSSPISPLQLLVRNGTLQAVAPLATPRVR